MRRAAAAAALVVLAACSSSGTAAPTTTLPGDLVPASASDATVSVVSAGVPVTVAPGALAKVLPILVRRVFDAAEPLSSYGLDHPRATITLTLTDTTTITLTIGGEDFDHTATYVQRSGDQRIWLVLNESLAPLLGG